MPYDESIALAENPLAMNPEAAPPKFLEDLHPDDRDGATWNPKTGTFKVAPEQSINPRDQYVAMAMQLQDMIRQRDQGQGGPNASQQPSEEELALKQQMAASNPFSQQVAQPRAMPAFQPPPTRVDEAEQRVAIANRQAAMARRQADNAVRDAMRLQRVRNVAEEHKVLAYTKQEYAKNRYNEMLQVGRNRGLDPETNRAEAAASVFPDFFGKQGMSVIAGQMKRPAQRPPPATLKTFTDENGKKIQVFVTENQNGQQFLRPVPEPPKPAETKRSDLTAMETSIDKELNTFPNPARKAELLARQSQIRSEIQKMDETKLPSSAPTPPKIDKAASLSAAKTFLKIHPKKRAEVIAKLKANGITEEP